MATLRNPAQWLIDALRGGGVGKSPKVTPETMIGSAAIWYAMNTIAGDVGKMPLEIKKRLNDGGSETQNKHPAHIALHDQPNELQTPDVFKELLQAHALGWGNGRAYINRRGGKFELLPLMPDRSTTVVVEGEKYHVTDPTDDDPVRFRNTLAKSLDEPGLLDRYLVYHDRDVFHVIGFGFDGIMGKSLADVARDSISNDLQSQRYQNRGLEKGFAGVLMLEAPEGRIRDEDEAEKFLAAFRARHENSKNGEAVGLLREGVTARVLNMSNRDAQFIENRRFNRQDVMLWFGLQHLPGDDSSVSYNSLEQKQLAYLYATLDRWLVRWEQQANAKLRTRGEKSRNKLYAKFNRGTLLRTDIKSTQEALSGYVQSTILTVNEAREMIDRNPVDGGDERANPAITPGEPGENNDDSNQNEPETPESDQNNAETPANRAETARIDAITSLIAIETRIVLGMVDNENNFCGAIDRFYDRWALTLLNGLLPLGTTPRTVDKLVSGHKTDLLSAAGDATDKNELRTAVKRKVEQWQNAKF